MVASSCQHIAQGRFGDSRSGDSSRPFPAGTDGMADHPGWSLYGNIGDNIPVDRARLSSMLCGLLPDMVATKVQRRGVGHRSRDDHARSLIRRWGRH